MKKPIYNFNNTSSTGINDVPLNGTIMIEDAGSGKPRQIILTNKANIDENTTISTLIGLTAQYESVVILAQDTSPQLGGNLDCNNKTINESAIRGISDATPGTGTTHTFNYVNGDMQQITCPASGTLTLAFSGFPSGKISGFIVDIVNGGNCTITHPSGMLFASGTTPEYTVSGTDRIVVISDKDSVLTLTVNALELGTES